MKKQAIKDMPDNLMEIGNSETFKLKISDCTAVFKPKDLESGLFVLLEAASSKSLTFEFNVNEELIICKIFTEDQKGYPEKFQFTPSQFAKLLRLSNRKKSNPLKDEEDIFSTAAKAKEIRTSPEIQKKIKRNKKDGSK